MIARGRLPPACASCVELEPDWEAPARVKAFVTGRRGGVSSGVYGAVDGAASGLNLGLHCGDDARAVAINRARLAAGLPSPPRWLQQVHGVAVHVAQANSARGASRPAGERKGSADDACLPCADAAVTAQAGVVLAVLTADCLPVLLSTASGAAVGVAHAGWRGLAGGVIERSVRALRTLDAHEAEVIAWLGPAIGPRAFEVGEDVWRAFCDQDPDSAACLAPTGRAGKWHADLYRLARLRLARAGVTRVSGGGYCTVSEPRRFYSHRGQGGGGRMATLIWIEHQVASR